MLEINGKSYEVHKVKLTKKDLKNLKKGEIIGNVYENKELLKEMEVQDDSEI